MNESQLDREVAQLHRRQRWLEALVGVMFLSLIGVTTIAWRAMNRLAHPQSLSLRRLDIVDEKGASRVVLASPAPPPVRFGKVGRRDGTVSGVLLIDATGTERGGYVTSDGEDGNALLTLDAQGKQTVLLLAEPQGNTLFRIWDRDKGSLVMGASETGPFLNVRKGDQIFLSAPTGNPQSKETKPLFR
jgi:hypothetical protein